MIEGTEQDLLLVDDCQLQQVVMVQQIVMKATAVVTRGSISGGRCETRTNFKTAHTLHLITIYTCARGGMTALTCGLMCMPRLHEILVARDARCNTCWHAPLDCNW